MFTLPQKKSTPATTRWLATPHILLIVTLAYLPSTLASAPSPIGALSGPAENPVPGDVLTDTQKTAICALPKKTLCTAAGDADDGCKAIATVVTGSSPRCDLESVCSFAMPADNRKPSNVTLPPNHTPPPKVDPILALDREPNRAYVTTVDNEDLILAKTCEQNGLYIFVPEKAKGEATTVAGPVKSTTK